MMKRSVRYSALTLALLTGSAAHARELPNFDAYFKASPALVATPQRVTPEPGPGGGVASTDARRGVPTFVWAARDQERAPASVATPEAAARWYLAQHARRYHLSPAALDTARVRQVHDTGRGGIIVVLGQEVEGIPLFRSEAKVLMTRDLGLVALSGALHPSAVPLPGHAGGPRGHAFRATPDQAIAGALHDLYRTAWTPADLSERAETKGGYRYFDLAAPPQEGSIALRFIEPARVKRVLFPLPDRVVPGYFLEIMAQEGDSGDQEAYAYVIAADDGRLLYRENLSHSVAFNYRVWADPTGLHIPLDGPQQSFTPHPSGMPDGSYPEFVSPILVSMEGFNTNPSGVADPWLPAGATATRGNNVDAYADHFNPNGFSNGDTRASTTSAFTFDRTYDPGAQPLASPDQIMASVTQIFYVTNWLHNWYYDSGFNEAAGNAQQDNFGRGGLGGDRLLAEAQDGAPGGNRNNANMNTGADGVSPRMQMYLWSAPDLKSLSIQPLNLSMQVSTAGFGPTNFNLTAPVLLAVDAVAPANDACQALTNVAQMAGKIALIDRGTCTFTQKVQNAQNAGAVGAIIANNAANEGPPQLGGSSGTITIPVEGISLEDGNALKAALSSGAVTATMTRESSTVERDGTIDNTIVAHEWGHYIHLRSVACGSAQCGAQSEGWGDFIALMMVLREGDDVDGVYPLAGYSTAVFADYYFGIRRAPYSVDFTRNALTFRHIMTGEPLPSVPLTSVSPDNAEVHNAGEIWASMLWEAYVGLVKRTKQPNPPYSFTEAKRRMSDYIVAGMKLAPASPTYTEQRDAILAAAFVADKADFTRLAESFSRRGAGSCAVSPPPDSENFLGVIESFKVSPEIDFRSAKVDDSVFSCDNDGFLDAQETGRVTLEIMNRGAGTLTDAKGEVSSTTPGVTFPGGTTVTFGTLEPFVSGVGSIDVALDGAVEGIEEIELTVTLVSAETCTPTQVKKVVHLGNFDEIASSARVDDVEAYTTTWAMKGDVGDSVWSRSASATSGKVWRGIDFPSVSDTSLESPDLQVSAKQAFVMKFSHRHKFEASQGQRWDGGVIELSTNGGLTWQSVSAYGQPGYNGTINNQAGNPLSNQQAYTDENPSWPALDTVSIDMGMALAGQTVRVRFRIGTDQAAGDFGWELDDIGFDGISNMPFATVIEDQAACEGVPVANAGADQRVPGNVKVTLDASGSTDPDNDPLTFTWAQVAGPAVELISAGAGASFTSPLVEEETTLTFEVTVSDGQQSAKDSVNVVVTTEDGGKPEPLSISFGCGCSVVGGPSGAALSPLVALAALALRRRRRQRG